MVNVVQYSSGEDYQAAKIIADATGWQLRKASTLALEKDRTTYVIVGGQESNPAYKGLMYSWTYVRGGGDYFYTLRNASGDAKVFNLKSIKRVYRSWDLDRLPNVIGAERGPIPTNRDYRPIVETDKDHIIVQKGENFFHLGKKIGTVVFVAGWNKEDTLAAARYIADNGFKAVNIPKDQAPGYYGLGAEPDPTPDDPVDPQPMRKGKIFEFYLRDMSGFLDKFPPTAVRYIGGGLTKLIAKKQVLIDGINKVIPEGWQLNQIEITNKKISLEFEERNTPFLIPLVILGIIVQVAIISGVFVTWWKVFDWKKVEQENVKIELEIEEKVQDTDFLKYLIENEIVTNHEEALEIIVALKRKQENDDDTDGGNLIDNLKEILIIALGGAIIIVLLQQTKRS